MEKLSEYLVCNMFGKLINTKEQKEVYMYGMTLLITNMLGIMSILLISALFFSISEGIVFLLVFSILRIHSGGYHCKTYLNCFIVSNLIFIIVLLTSRAITMLHIFSIAVLNCALLVSSLILVLLYAPVIPDNHRLSNKRLMKNRKKAVVLSSGLTLVCYICMFIGLDNTTVVQYCTLVAITVTAVSVLMLISKIKERSSKNV